MKQARAGGGVTAPGGGRTAPRMATARALFACAVATALMLHLVRVSKGIEEAIASRVAELPFRVVLKEERRVSDGESLADRIRERWPAAKVTVIGSEEGQALVGIQEPWMANLPEVEVGALPVIVEFRHPAVLESEEAVAEVESAVAAEPETDFVAFNHYGHDSFLELARATRSRALGTLWFAGAVLGVLCLLPVRWRAREIGASAMAGAVLGVAGGLAGWVLSIILTAFTGNDLPGVGLLAPGVVIAGLAGVMALGGALGALRNRVGGEGA